MNLSEVIFDLKIKGSRSHIDYDIMVENWYIENNNPIPTLQLCVETWNNVSIPRLTVQAKQERILNVKAMAHEILKHEHDWKVIKQYTTQCWNEEEFFIIKQEMQNIRTKSNEIETEINALTTLDDVINYIITFD